MIRLTRADDRPDPIVDRMYKSMSRGLPIGLGMVTAFFLKDEFDGRWSEEPDNLLLIANLIVLATLAVLTWWVHWKPNLSYHALRGVEFLAFGSMCLFIAAFQGAELRSHAAAMLGQADARGLMEALNDSFILRWAFPILGYAIFIPNTIKRSIVAVAIIAMMPILVTCGFCYLRGCLDLAADLVVETTLWATAFAATGFWR